MEIRQIQKLSQVLALTPQMKQSLQILQLPLLELRAYLESQLEENPVLESEDLSLADETGIPKESLDKLIEHKEDLSSFSSQESHEELQKKRDYKESLITKPPTLQEHLLNNLRMASFKEKKYEIAEFIVGNLDEDGYLNISLEEIVNSLNKKYSPHEQITKKETEEIIHIIQALGPPGIGAKNLKDCLLIQLRLKNRQKSLAYKIAEGYLAELAKNNFKLIAKKLKVSMDELNKARKEISKLEPRPGRTFSFAATQEISHSSVDISVENVEGQYKVSANIKGIPRLRISKYYLNLLKSKQTSAETKEYIRDKLKAALGLIKAVSQREETINKIAELIVNIQKDFFEHNDTSLLKPLTLKDVAKIVNRNESTISRVVNSKYMDTPFGVYRLDYFFAKSLKTDAGKSISDEYIKCRILNLVEEEDTKKPLKDGDITSILKNDGIKLARRTVAKYREQMDIPPYNRRRAI